MTEVTAEDLGDVGTASGEGVADVTGSMAGKLAEAFEVAAASGQTWVIGGNRPGRLKAVLEGRRVKGTRVVPPGG
jgi:isopentenyl phosphate kinase